MRLSASKSERSRRKKSPSASPGNSSVSAEALNTSPTRPCSSKRPHPPPWGEETRLLAAIILAAGASSRMGRPKALLPYRESTFLEHLVEAARHPRIGWTRVVLGAGADEIRKHAQLDTSVVVLNPD